MEQETQVTTERLWEEGSIVSDTPIGLLREIVNHVETECRCVEGYNPMTRCDECAECLHCRIVQVLDEHEAKAGIQNALEVKP